MEGTKTTPSGKYHLPPRELYKYYRFDGDGFAFRVLEMNEVYFSNPIRHFNDPFDCRLPLDMEGSLEQWKRKLRSSAEKKGIRLKGKELHARALRSLRNAKNPETRRSISEDVVSNLGVFCVSEAADDVLMFSHYADNHRGMCVGFNCGTEMYESFFYRGSRFVDKVNYESNYQPPNYFTSDEDEKLHWTMFTKSWRWRYEQEWRVIDWGGFGPRQFPEDMLLDVSLGCQVAPENRERVKAILDDRGLKVPIYQCKRKPNAFEVERERVA